MRPVGASPQMKEDVRERQGVVETVMTGWGEQLSMSAVALWHFDGAISTS
jgi:hypothetical protein